MTRHFFSATLALGLSLVGSASFAQDCKVEGDPWDLDDAGVAALYSCIETRMIEGYTKGDNPVAAEYRSWAVTATRPAVAGPHGERFLYTFANETAAEQYLKFEEEGVVMPVGSILAKESITIGKKGKQKDKARPGPLFIMEKVAAGTADEFGNWVYSAVQPNGKPMKIKQSFCSNCHVGWEAQDHLGYPLEDVRLKTE